MVAVLAVPDSPTNRQGRPDPTVVLSSQVERTTSTVGTKILENMASAGGTYAFTWLFHDCTGQNCHQHSNLFTYGCPMMTGRSWATCLVFCATHTDAFDAAFLLMMP